MTVVKIKRPLKVSEAVGDDDVLWHQSLGLQACRRILNQVHDLFAYIQRVAGFHGVYCHFDDVLRSVTGSYYDVTARVIKWRLA